MFKAMILLQRNASMTSAEFKTWWLEEHAPLARQLPGVKRAVFNLVDKDENGDESGYDGVSELWFDNQQAFEQAYQSDIGQAVAADSMQHVARRERMFVNEHHIVPNDV